MDSENSHRLSSNAQNPPNQILSESSDQYPNRIIEFLNLSSNLIPLEISQTEKSHIDLISTLFLEPHHIMIVTGPGVSSPSVDTANIPSLSPFVKNAILERDYYKILRTIHGKQFRQEYLFGSLLPILEANPNKIHQHITKLFQISQFMESDVNINTLNIDHLQEKTIKDLEDEVIHLLGTLAVGKCDICGKKYDYLSLLQKYQEKPDLHSLFQCKSHKKKSNCPGIISPAIVEYGEPIQNWRRILQITHKADILILVGTGFNTQLESSLVDQIKTHDGKVIVLTTTPHINDDRIDYLIDGDLDDILNQIFTQIKEKILSTDGIRRKIKRKIKKL